MPYVSQRGLPPINDATGQWHYRWIASDPERLAMHLLGHGDRPGYKIVNGETFDDTAALAVELIGVGADQMVNKLTNRIQFGQSILARIPMTEYKSRLSERRTAERDRRDDEVDAYMAKTTRRGIRPYIAEEGEVQDRKEYARRDGGGRVSMAGTRRSA